MMIRRKTRIKEWVGAEKPRTTWVLFAADFGRLSLPRRVESVDCEGLISAEIPAELSAPTIIEQFLDAHPGAEMVAKRQQPYSTQLFGHREFTRVIEETLTDRQQEVLAAAHETGYYEWPRETAGDELAEELGISPPTFHEHLRAAEQKLITAFLD